MTKCRQLKPIHVPDSGFRSAYDYYERESVDNFITEMKEMHNNVVSKLRRCLYVAKANNICLIDQIEYLYRNKASVHWNNGKNNLGDACNSLNKALDRAKQILINKAKELS